MRKLRWILSIVVLLALIGAGGTFAYVGTTRSTSYDHQEAQLQARWAADIKEGVAATQLQPLKTDLADHRVIAKWWSPSWIKSPQTALLTTLQAKTASIWAEAVATARQQAQLALTSWQSLVTADGSDVPTALTTAAKGWSAQLSSASTPAELTALAMQWQSATDQARTTVIAVRTQRVDTELSGVGGPQVLMKEAQQLDATAAVDNLDNFGAPALVTQLQAELTANDDATTTAAQLLTAVDSLKSLISLNNQVAAQLYPLQLDVDATLAESTPNSASLAAQYTAAHNAFVDSSTSAALTAAGQQFTTLTTQVNSELTANSCGHDVPTGKVITISLSLQESVFYDNGCAVMDTGITTGRPALPTPTGTFHVFQKLSPITFVSTDPPGSEYWYPTTTASYGMEFDAGGYYLHDWPYEASQAYGPGSEDNLDSASHGCVHYPPSVIKWAYSWTPMGTTVIISA